MLISRAPDIDGAVNYSRALPLDCAFLIEVQKPVVRAQTRWHTYNMALYIQKHLKINNRSPLRLHETHIHCEIFEILLKGLFFTSWLSRNDTTVLYSLQFWFRTRMAFLWELQQIQQRSSFLPGLSNLSPKGPTHPFYPYSFLHKNQSRKTMVSRITYWLHKVDKFLHLWSSVSSCMKRR